MSPFIFSHMPLRWSLKVLISYHVSCAWRINKDQQDVWLIILVVLNTRLYMYMFLVSSYLY